MQDNLARAQFVISFLEKENKQLSEKQVLLEMDLLKDKRKDVKGKAVMGHDQSDEDEAQITKKRPKTRGLKRALEQEKQHETEELNFEERISMEINENREVCLDRVKIHLESLLHKKNKDNQMLRHMVDHYHTRNRICNVKVKQLWDKLKQTLISEKEKGKLDLTTDASLVA